MSNILTPRTAMRKMNEPQMVHKGLNLEGKNPRSSKNSRELASANAYPRKDSDLSNNSLVNHNFPAPLMSPRGPPANWAMLSPNKPTASTFQSDGEPYEIFNPDSTFFALPLDNSSHGQPSFYGPQNSGYAQRSQPDMRQPGPDQPGFLSPIGFSRTRSVVNAMASSRGHHNPISLHRPHRERQAEATGSFDSYGRPAPAPLQISRPLPPRSDINSNEGNSRQQLAQMAGNSRGTHQHSHMNPNVGSSRPQSAHMGGSSRGTYQNLHQTPDRLRSDGILVVSSPLENSSTNRSKQLVVKRRPNPDRKGRFKPFATEHDYFTSKVQELNNMCTTAHSLPDFPNDNQGRSELVQEIVDAIYDTSSDVNEADTRDYGQSSEKLVYNTAWELLYATAACQGDYQVVKKHVASNIKKKRYNTFMERFGDLVTALRESKALCRGVLHEGPAALLAINAPAELKRKSTNKKLNNRRNVEVKLGKQVLKNQQAGLVDDEALLMNNNGEELQGMSRKRTRDDMEEEYVEETPAPDALAETLMDALAEEQTDTPAPAKKRRAAAKPKQQKRTAAK